MFAICSDASLAGLVAACAGAWGQCELAWIGEAEACGARCASGEHGGEDAGPLVEVVVDFGGGLVLVGAQDPAWVLGQAALAGDRRGEEEGIRGRTVEALAGVGAVARVRSGGPPGTPPGSGRPARAAVDRLRRDLSGDPLGGTVTTTEATPAGPAGP